MCERLSAEGKNVFVLVWGNATWQVSRRVRRWNGAHNRRVKRKGGCKIVVCHLPVNAHVAQPD